MQQIHCLNINYCPFSPKKHDDNVYIFQNLYIFEEI